LIDRRLIRIKGCIELGTQLFSHESNKLDLLEFLLEDARVAHDLSVDEADVGLVMLRAEFRTGPLLLLELWTLLAGCVLALVGRLLLLLLQDRDVLRRTVGLVLAAVGVEVRRILRLRGGRGHWVSVVVVALDGAVDWLTVRLVVVGEIGLHSDCLSCRVLI